MQAEPIDIACDNLVAVPSPVCSVAEAEHDAVQCRAVCRVMQTVACRRNNRSCVVVVVCAESASTRGVFDASVQWFEH